MSALFNEDNANTHQQRGDDVAVLAAILIVAALSSVELGAEDERDKPLVVIFRILERLVRYIKTVFPDHERVQDASLDIAEELNAPGNFLVDSEIFFDAYIRLSYLAPIPAEVSPILIYLQETINRGYSCVRQAAVGATEGLNLVDLPSDEEFYELMSCFAFDDLNDLSLALAWAFDSDVHFGVLDDGTFPALEHMKVIEQYRDKLASAASALPQNTNRVGLLKQRLAQEIDLMATVFQAARTVFFSIDKTSSLEGEESLLADGINGALTPPTRVVAAEHLSYIQNRIARRAVSPMQVVVNYTEACRLAHFAFNVGGGARYAKYMAQNLLEIAMATRESSRRILAEMIWVDAYATPYILGLTSVDDSPFIDIGWMSPVFTPTDIAIDYSVIPPYSLEPDFIYTGWISERVRGISSSFTSDLWTASLLLVQHLKDLGEFHELPDPNNNLALFMPADNPKERFPLREQHPVAWLYFLSEMLLREHESLRKPHAGLYGARPALFWYRRWLGSELLTAFRTSPSERFQSSRTPKFPQVAKYLLEPVANSSHAIGTSPAIWSMIAARWQA